MCSNNIWPGACNGVSVSNIEYWCFLCHSYECWCHLGLELNPAPLKMNCVNQDGQGSANTLNQRLKLLNYFTNRQLVKRDSPNGHQIAASLVPLRTQSYVEVVACLKKVKTRPDTGPANEHQLLPVPYPELAAQLASSGDVVNRSGGTKHHPFCLPELD
ncbi:hypothetical protein DSO57_1002425 [Entomophthora muscae]|uniref:Uncharacterized protein n=1 Tax=Entomophthora muscae TaxID=34485 RepID=A0ACC2SAY4_9FUNG|nr:hypothetical protein DSO57_1002425 [Entomophthora muscae]